MLDIELMLENKTETVKKMLNKYLPPDGEKLIGFEPTCVWRRCSIRMGFDASFAEEERFRCIGPPKSSFCGTMAFIALKKNIFES